MAGLLNQRQSSQVNPNLLLALLLVRQVRLEVQALIPQAQAVGSVTVGENQIRHWESALQEASSAIQRIPVPLIFPPPAFSVFANAAVQQIDVALQILRSITITAPLIFPPQSGQGVISLQVLNSLVSTLRQAETFLIQSVQSV